MSSKSYKEEVIQYARNVVAGKIKAGGNVRECRRFLNWLERTDIELRPHDPDMVINIIRKIIVHRQGEDLKGNPLTNKPLILLPWQMFVVYNLVGWYYKGTNIRVVKEAFIFVPRKNGKTLLVAALAFAIGIISRKSGAQGYITAAALKQTQEAFQDLKSSLQEYIDRLEDALDAEKNALDSEDELTDAEMAEYRQAVDDASEALSAAFEEAGIEVDESDKPEEDELPAGAAGNKTIDKAQKEKTGEASGAGNDTKTTPQADTSSDAKTKGGAEGKKNALTGKLSELYNWLKGIFG